ncbi:hypothetical protein ACWEMJ_31800, partial [Kitasatospora sp. NPDC004531]
MSGDWTSELIVPDGESDAAGPAGPVALAPDGYRPDPRMTRQQCADAVARGGWLFRADEGHDPDGPVPVGAVEGAWQVDDRGVPLRFWANPRYGAPVPERAVVDAAAPLPPLLAGRHPAGRALLGWLEDQQAPRLCRVAGSSGSGRSHLLRWLTAACPPDNPHTGRRVDVQLSAAETTVDTFVWRLAGLLGVSAGDPDELVAALIDGVPRVVVVTDLDRAGAASLPDAARRIAAEVLRPLLRVPWLRIVLECASDTPAAAALDVPAAVLDLDQPQWTDLDAFTRWASSLADRPLPAEVYPSPALALLAARTGDGILLDAGASLARRAETLAETWWESLPEIVQGPVVTLASVRGPLDAELWGELPGSLGPFAVEQALDLLLPADPDGRYRIWPDTFAERLARDGLDHLSIRQNVLPDQPGPKDADRLGLVLRHAVRTSAPVADLLADPAVLVHADPSAVGPALEHDGGGDGASARRAWWSAGPVVTAAEDPRERAAALHCWTAGQDGGGELAERFARLAGLDWRVRWAFGRRGDAVRLLARNNGAAGAGQLAVAVGRELELLDAADGRALGTMPLPSADLAAVALATGVDGGAYVLRRSGEVAGAGAAVRQLLASLDAGATAIAVRGGEPRAVAAGDAAGRLLLLDERDGAEVVRSDAALHDGPVTALDLASHGGHPLLISGGADGVVQAWTPGRGLLSAPLPGRDAAVTAVGVAATPNG